MSVCEEVNKIKPKAKALRVGALVLAKLVGIFKPEWAAAITAAVAVGDAAAKEVSEACENE